MRHLQLNSCSIYCLTLKFKNKNKTCIHYELGVKFSKNGRGKADNERQALAGKNNWRCTKNSGECKKKKVLSVKAHMKLLHQL